MGPRGPIAARVGPETAKISNVVAATRWTSLSSLTPLLALALVGGCAAGCSGSGGSHGPHEVQLRARPGPAPAPQAPAKAPGATELALAPTAPTSEAIEAAHRRAHARVASRGADPQPPLPPVPDGPLPGPEQVPPPEDGETPDDYEGPLPGFFTPMEVAPLQLAPDGTPLPHPLDPWFAALAALEDGTAKGPVHVVLYGASGTAADLWTAYVRGYLQARFGDAGPGLVAAARPTRWYRHNEVDVETSKRGWTKHNTYRLEEGEGPGYFGAMGQTMSSDRAGAWTQLQPKADSPASTSVSYYDVHFLRKPGGGTFRVKIDGKALVDVPTDHPRPMWAEAHFRLDEVWSGDDDEPRPPLRIEILGDGDVELLGVDMGNEAPGIVVDTLGVNGAKLANQLEWEPHLWKSHLRDRAPVLYVLAFGNNESVDEDEPIALYEEHHRTVLDRYRADFPDAACVLVGPGDFPKIDEETDEPLPRPRLDALRDVQRELAEEYDCGFIDALAIIGGERGKVAWHRAGLAREDLLHLTRDGYLRFGRAIADALVQPYDTRRAALGDRAPTHTPVRGDAAK